MKELPFKFKLNVINLSRKKAAPKTVILRKDAQGIIVYRNDNPSTGEVQKSLFVYCSDEYIPVHPKSFDTFHKRRVYVQDPNSKVWIEYDRVCSEDRVKMPPCYIPFKPKNIAIGSIIVENGTKYFKIRVNYNSNSNLQFEEAMRNLKELDAIDEFNSNTD